jgi:murein DD-endopeptidase MepM/ murein hydrolase activator NlpD
MQQFCVQCAKSVMGTGIMRGIAFRIGLAALVIVMLPGVVDFRTASAQPQCGYATSISYPIDTSVFRLVQGYAASSQRHQGRFHTGEDWALGRGGSLGHPVRAIAAGRVTYSYHLGWGRDGGVVIIEHTLPDDTIIYSQYGHVAGSDTVEMPRRWDCVEAGQIIAVITDSRPAPHLHFEIRANNPDIPGPGYTREHPTELGWRHPERIVTNLQARLHPSYRWHASITGYNVAVPPMLLDDHSLIVAVDNVLRRVTPDGRVLWRITRDRPAASVTGFQTRPLVTFADGLMTRIDFDGSVDESWQVAFSPNGAPLRMGESLLFHTIDDALVALTPNRRELLWRLEGVPAYVHGHVSDRLIALVTHDELWLISHDGQLIDRVELRAGASLATAPDGGLVAYTHGGLWRISAGGEWSQALEDVPNGGGSGAVAITDDGRIYLMNGTHIYAYSRTGAPAWEARLPLEVTGLASMHHYGSAVLITSSHGQIIAVRDSGGICGFTRLYGDDQTGYWHHLGGDGLLRLAVGDQLLGLDWRRFTGGC